MCIHVCRYFRAYLQHITHRQDVDISVHCECDVFAWLLAYAEGRASKLTAQAVLPILIASNFLQVRCTCYTAHVCTDLSDPPSVMTCA